MEAFAGVVIGGLVSIATTIVIDRIRARRELKQRWDVAGLDAIAHFIEVVNLSIAALYDEGISRHRQPDSELTVQLDRAARAAMDAVRVSHAKARLVMSPLSTEFAAYYESLVRLKDLADVGFQSGDPAWKEAQSALRRDLDALLQASAGELQIRTPK